LDTSGVQWLHRKIFAVKLEAHPTIYNISFHRSICNGQGECFLQQLLF